MSVSISVSISSTWNIIKPKKRDLTSKPRLSVQWLMQVGTAGALAPPKSPKTLRPYSKRNFFGLQPSPLSLQRLKNVDVDEECIVRFKNLRWAKKRKRTVGLFAVEFFWQLSKRRSAIIFWQPPKKNSGSITASMEA